MAPWPTVPIGGAAGLLRSGRLIALWWRRSLLGAAVVAAWLGALTAPAHLTLVVAPVLGALTAGTVLVGAACIGSRRPSPRALALSGLGGLLLVPFLVGVQVLGAAGAALSLALLMTAAARVPVDPLAAASPAAPTREELARLGAELRRLPSAQLLEHWQRTAAPVHRGAGPDVRAAVTEFRSLLLDEFSRRDPAGVERWLRTGGDPARHLASGEADRTA